MSDLIDKFFAFIATYKMFILLFTVILIFLKLFSRMLMEEWRARWHHKWRENREKKLELKRVKKEKKTEEKTQKKYRTYKSSNALFLKIVKKHRTIIFVGEPGAGKSSMMTLFARFITDMLAYNENKNYRYNKLMNPKFLQEREFLRKNKLLPIYTNMSSIEHPKTKFKAMTNLDDVFKLKKKAFTPCVFAIDEMPNTYGKELRFEIQSEKDPEKKRDYEAIKKVATKPRHYGIWILATAQDGDDIVYTFRNVPHCIIKAIETEYQIQPIGKRIQKFKILFNKIMPGWFVSNPKKMFAECLFTYQKVILFFKLFLPGFFANEKQFYINRNNIYKQINEKFGFIKTLWKYGDKVYWTYYKPIQSLKYDHLEYAEEYSNIFDKEGNRKPLEVSA